MFERIKDILKNKTVGIAGCGGLGSNCAVALARSGIGKLIIADFDTIDEGNLNRQYYFYDQIGQKKVEALKENIQRINPKVHVVTYDKKLVYNDIAAIYEDCDVIVEAFDLAVMKQMILEAKISEMTDIPIVCGVGLAGWGNTNTMKIKQYDDIYICGDAQSEVSEEMPPLAPKVGVASNMQADTVLELLLKGKV